jgi:hexosaminidase
MKLIPLIMILFTTTLKAQPNAAALPASLKIDWQLQSNHHLQSNTYLATLTLSNTSSNLELPPNGWTLYYNSFKDLSETNIGHGLQSYRLQGDLFCIKPTADFKGLKPNESVALSLTGYGWSYNVSDAPTGFYLVWDNRPEQAFNLTQVSALPPSDMAGFSRWPNTKPPHVTPQTVYEANKSITDIDEAQLPAVFPTPIAVKATLGTFTITKNILVSPNVKFKNEAQYLVDELVQFTGNKLPIGIANKSAIQLSFDASLPEEGYKLTVAETGVNIIASTPTGLFYGIQSLKCLFPLDVWKNPQPSLTIKCMEVTDAPRFAYRGLHVDVARNFQTKAQLFRLLNWMAMYKLNVLHFHFCDDEAWRLEIPQLPELTAVGAVRGHMLANPPHMPPAYGSGGDTNNRQSGLYSRADYIEILRFAKARHIEVIPEIETPGHARAAIKAMEARYDRLSNAGKTKEAETYLLSDPNDVSIHSSPQNFTDNVMCVAMPSVYLFIETVVDELIAMHKEADMPLKTIHVGGDEVPSGSWEKSPLCQSLLAKLPADQYKQTSDLWPYYWGKIDTLFSKRGLYVSGWEEIGIRKSNHDGRHTKEINPLFANRNFHPYVWNTLVGWGSEDVPYQLANRGYKVVMCPVTHTYFDLAYQPDFNEPGQYWGGFLDTDKPFGLIPYDYTKNVKTDIYNNPIDPKSLQGKERLTDTGRSNIVGIQGQLWSENMRNAEQQEYFAFPKMLALAERAWAKDPEWALTTDAKTSQQQYEQAWSEFANIVGKHELVKLCYYQGGVNFRIPTVGAKIENGLVMANIQFPGLTIRYTTNGTEPNAQSEVYIAPIATKTVIQLRAFDVNGRGGRTIFIDNSN